MSDIPHLGFIVAAYGVTAVVLLAMILAVLLDGRAQIKMLAKLEARTGRRAKVRPQPINDRTRGNPS